jgi:hypothetical protein
VRTWRRYRIRRWAILALVVFAVAAPAAQAMPVANEGRNGPPITSMRQVQPVSNTPAVVQGDDSFNWGNAGIIAGSVFAASLAGFGVLTLRSRNRLATGS